MGNSRPASPAAPAGTVHPHACGERFSKGLGKLFTNRFIPTHVGNGTWPRGPACSLPVHPHACGERPIDTEAVPGGNGSSPRMWGTGGKRKCSVGRDRFIPTHVGNGMAASASKPVSSVHPHACGERGRDHRPACRVCPVHPHACGERVIWIRPRPMKRGSSPRMWGTAALDQLHAHLHRFIPTHVGNGQCLSPTSAQYSGSSPRMWGTGQARERSLVFGGSSPRMWGTVQLKALLDCVIRFIPTHVGNGSSCLVCSALKAVHPHACGERFSSGVSFR